MSKKVLFNQKAHKKILKGINILADAVRVTLGPKGKNVMIESAIGMPIVSNDGVSIAKEISLEDNFENMGAALVKGAAANTNEVAGDGTTSATILTQAIANEGLKNITSGNPPRAIKRGLDKGLEASLKELEKITKKISDDELESIATNSADDEEMGRVIAEVMRKVGKDGVVTVETSQVFGIEHELVKGVQIEHGYISPYMVTDQEKMVCELKEPAILVTDREITSINEILPILEKLAQKGKKELVIFAENVKGEALATIAVNNIKGLFKILAVKYPASADKDAVQDIAIATGAEYISEETGTKLESATLDMLGKAKKVLADKKETVIIDGGGSKDVLQKRTNAVKEELDKAPTQFRKDKLRKRYGKLTGLVGVIKVGAATDTESDQKQQKIEDALNATKAAMAEGIVPGGGVAFLKMSKVLNDLNLDRAEEQVGVDILRRALESPMRQLAENAGIDGGEILSKARDGKQGFDFRDMEWCDLLEKGVIDPAKVVRSALENAVSAAGMFLTTDAAIADLPEVSEPKRVDKKLNI